MKTKLSDRTRERLVFAFLLTLGLLQMAGKLINQPKLAGLAAATNASPHPKVFSSVLGLETYSTSFFLDWRDQEGNPHSLELNPETYSRIRGPYNRRNVYGAALAYGPVLSANDKTKAMFDQILDYALRGEAPLLRELGIDPETVVYPVVVRLEVEPGTKLQAELPLRFEINDDDDAEEPQS
jgi:hypothetical protein